ncbi:hypothetical protein GCM10023337_02470 [Paenalcaligenes hermetiae]|uniref:Uncharacterized protein n=1 Tax=Paenalcaligenes hermetiae TaxID=1157987 RepID=A0ABP9LVM2_9BURK
MDAEVDIGIDARLLILFAQKNTENLTNKAQILVFAPPKSSLLCRQNQKRYYSVWTLGNDFYEKNA